MRRSIQRRTVYAATLITILALAGGWTFAATLVTSNPPPQSSSITVIAPGSFTTATVQSTELVTVTAPIAALTAAGVQAPTGQGGLNSITTNALLPQCSSAPESCGGNYSAVDVATALTEGDVAVQVSLQVTQATSAIGFDVQVELILGNGNFVFGNGYFDSNTNTVSSTVWVMLFIDTGESALTPPTLAHAVVTMNACIQATTCP
jgi:hypothetical protein